MRLNRLDLNLLVALDALLSERSITRAAERLFLSQPATSGALARLREFFDDELLVRVGAKMVPTPLGESLQVPVHNILMQIQATVDRGIEFEAKKSDRRFCFLGSDFSATVALSHVVRRLAKEAPEIQLEFMMAGDDPSGRLERGSVDFLVMPEHVISSEHPSIKLFDDKFVCLLDAENEFNEETLTEEAYFKAGHVTVRFGRTGAKTQDQVMVMDKYGTKRRFDVIASTFDAIPQYIVGTNRIATVYSRLAERWCELLPLKIVPCPMELTEISWHLQWHEYRNADPGVLWMRNFITETLAESETH